MEPELLCCRTDWFQSYLKRPSNWRNIRLGTPNQRCHLMLTPDNGQPALNNHFHWDCWRSEQQSKSGGPQQGWLAKDWKENVHIICPIIYLFIIGRHMVVAMWDQVVRKGIQAERRSKPRWHVQTFQLFLTWTPIGRGYNPNISKMVIGCYFPNKSNC